MIDPVFWGQTVKVAKNAGVIKNVPGIDAYTTDYVKQALAGITDDTKGASFQKGTVQVTAGRQLSPPRDDTGRPAPRGAGRFDSRRRAPWPRVPCVPRSERRPAAPSDDEWRTRASPDDRGRWFAHPVHRSTGPAVVRCARCTTSAAGRAPQQPGRGCPAA